MYAADALSVRRVDKVIFPGVSTYPDLHCQRETLACKGAAQALEAQLLKPRSGVHGSCFAVIRFCGFAFCGYAPFFLHKPEGQARGCQYDHRSYNDK